MGAPLYLYRSLLNAPPTGGAQSKTSSPASTGVGGTLTKVPTVDIRHAFIQSHRGQPTAVTAVNSGPLPYVIVGCGFAATLNLVTLLKSEWGRSRLNNRAVIFIGFPDPWQCYIGHGMNQEVELLTLPGFKNRPEPPDPLAAARWLHSKAFAGFTASEMKMLLSYGNKISQLCAVVVKIEKLEKDTKTLYKISLKDESPMAEIEAAMVDVCVGTGQAQLMRNFEGVIVGKTLQDEYTQPMAVDAKVTFKQQPRVFAAEMYVRENVNAANGGGRSVCFHGASPASIQAMEHSLGMDGINDRSTRVEEAFIYSTGKGMNEGFLPGGRLDELAQGDNDQPLRKRHDTAQCGKLKPTMDGVWFGEEGFVLTKVEEYPPYDFLKVTFKGGERLVDQNGLVSQGAPRDYTYGFYEQVVIGSGRRRDGHSLLDQALVRSLKAVETGHGIAVAAETPPEGKVGGGVRLLGASAMNFLISEKFTEKPAPTEALNAYQDSLPCQARVNLEGVTVCALMIAYANRYFELKPGLYNHNVNTATEMDLKGVLSGQEKLVNDIMEARNCRISPFKNYVHLVRVLERYRTKQAATNTNAKQFIQTWPEFIDNFNRDEAFLDDVRFRVWRDDRGWQSLGSEEKEALKKLTFSYGGNELGESPDTRAYPESYA